MILFDGVHMMTDHVDLQELHDKALEIGLRPISFQDHPVHPHYDVWGGPRSRLTINCTSRELVRRCTRRCVDMSASADVSVPGFDSEIASLLAEEYDEFHLRPKDCVVRKMTELVHGALSDGEDPSVAVITFGDGGAEVAVWRGTEQEHRPGSLAQRGGGRGVSSGVHPLGWGGEVRVGSGCGRRRAAEVDRVGGREELKVGDPDE